MASKKVFTSLEFQSGAKLIAPKVELRTPAATLTDPEDNDYYTGSAGQLAYGADTNLYVHNGTGWKALHHAGSAFSTDKVITSTKDDGAPFVVADSTRVDNLKAELLGTSTDTLASGTHRISTTATEHGIPVYGVNGVLKVGTPVADDDAAPKVYVDNAVQGLDHKESVKYTTTDNITLENLTAQSNLDTGSDLHEGQRILVKDQDDAYENGIYIAKNNDDWERATDADFGSNLIAGVNTNFTGANLAAHTSWADGSSGTGTVTLDAAADKLKIKAVSGAGLPNRGKANLTVTGLTVGKNYRLEVAIADQQNGAIRIDKNGFGGTDLAYRGLGVGLGDGTYALEFVALTTGAFVQIEEAGQSSGSTVYTMLVDTVTLKEADLNEGAFVFVEQGDTKANSSWVKSDSEAWTQFSGAGQITVQSNGAVVDATTGGPLVKSGDNINFKFGTSYFDINSTDGTLEIGAGAVGTGRLADDAVEPAKLLETGAFQMARLGLGVAAHASYGLIVKNDAAPGSHIRLLNGSELGFINLRDDGDLDIWAHGSNKIQFKTGAGSGVNRAFITETGVGIGADATSPSGTLHVSTARYGSELVAASADQNWGTAQADSGNDTNDRATFNAAYAWNTDGAITDISVASNVLQFTSAPSGTSGLYYPVASGIVAGRRYRIVIGTGTITGGTFKVRLWTGSYVDVGTLTASTTNTFDFTAPASVAGNLYINTTDAGATIQLTAASVTTSLKEDNLAAGVHAYGNDLVVSGNDNTGISIIGQAGATSNLYFGDGLQKDFARITSTRVISGGDANLFLQVSDGGAAATTAMTLFGADKSVKIEGGLGVGMGYTAGSGTLAVKGAADDGVHVWKSDGSVRIAMLEGDGTEDGVLILKNSSGTTKASFSSNSTSYFNGGNVAIGDTAAETGSSLFLKNGTSDTSLCIHTNTDTVGKYSAINFKTVSTGNKTAYQKGSIFYENTNGSETVSSSGVGVGSLVFAIRNDDQASNATPADAVLVLNPEGHHDHKANSIVNSSTVQGLQDGACYDFDGTDDYIAVGTSLWSANGDRTFSIWLKAVDFSTQVNIFHTEGGSGDFALTTSGKIRIHPVASNYQDTVNAISAGVWHHIVFTQTSSARKIYVDGVEQTLATATGSPQTVAWNSPATELRIADDGNRDNFDGQIRDVKILSSALTAPDVRKLYSGENPKKNLNVDVENGLSQTSGVTEWSVSGKTATTSGANFKQFDIAVSPSITAMHLMKVTVASYSGSGYLQQASLTSYGQFNSNGTSVASTAWGNSNGVWYVLLTGSSTGAFSLYGKNTFVGSVTIDWITEVETLVDFNPRSASTTKWYNQAIPSLYHGTLAGGVTLSAGNTYWNNIKQDGTNVESTELTLRKQFTNTTTVERLLTLDTHDKSAAIALNAGDGVGILFKVPEATDSAIGASIDAEKTDNSDTNTSTRLMFRVSQSDETLDAALKLDQDLSAQFYGNVGIGVTPSSNNPLSIHQAGASNNSYVHITHVDSGATASDGISIGLDSTGLNAVVRLREAGTLGFYTSNTARLTIDSAGHLSATSNDSDAQLTLTPTGTNASGIINFLPPGTGSAIIQCNDVSALTISQTGDTKVHGKLGVGGDPGTEQLLVTGTGKFIGTLDVTATAGEMQFGIHGGTYAGYGGISSTTSNKGLLFGVNSGGTQNWTAMALDKDGNLGIGTVAPQSLLELRRPVASHSNGWYASINSDIPGAASKWIGLHIGYGQDGGNSYRKSGIAFERTDGDYARGKFHIINDGAGDTAVAQLTDSVQFWDYDGTQNHQANRIVNSQTVNDLHRTAEPSLRFDGTDDEVSIADNNALDLVTNGTVVVIFRATNVGSASVATSWQSIVSKRAAGTNYEVGIEDNGRMFLYNGSAVSYFAFIPTNDVWTHCAVVYSGATASLYINGVFQESISSALGAVNAHSLGIGAIPNSGGQRFTGEIKDVRIHNRALEATEVAAAYNGESTPWKYADAGSVLIDEDFNTDLGVWESANGGSNSWATQNDTEVANKMYLAASATNQTCNPSAAVLSKGKVYRITYDCSGASNNPKWGTVSSGTPVDTDLTAITGSSTIVNGTGVIFEFVPKGNPQLHIFATAHDSIATLDNIKLEEIGEVAAYTPQSITELREITYGGSLAEFDTWCDTTSNGNHGKITGATIVGNNHVYAPLTVKGRSEVGDSNSFNDGCIWLGDHATNRGLIDYDEGTGQGLLRISSYRNATGAKLELATYRTPRLDIDGAGTVRATNSGGNLKQVARVSNHDFTITDDGDTYVVLTHNLGTTNIIISVRTDTAPYEHIEVATKAGDNDDTLSTVGNKCTITFASNPAADTNYTATVIG